MNDLILSMLLGLLQGLTEFLPISSSAHLLFPNLIFGSNDLGLSFDIAVHAGTLVAVIYFFRSEIILMMKSFFINESSLFKHKQLALYLFIATLPVVFAGFTFSDLLEQRIFSISHIAIANLFFAFILLVAFVKRKANKNLFQITIFGALIIGLFQSFALIPGASRSGTAITAALLIGMNIKDASKFSFMLSIPTIMGALALLLIEIQTINIDYNLIQLIIGFVVSMIFAFFTIKLFLEFVERIGMVPFVIYRIILGLFLLLIV
tara:strand:- start:36 stop:827 length:792 start_codon:yes stop_codon:yes gene_type:complete